MSRREWLATVCQLIGAPGAAVAVGFLAGLWWGVLLGALMLFVFGVLVELGKV